MVLFPNKETLTIEFKSDKKCISDSVIIEAVVGISNADGGAIYLGIEDNGKITGVHPNHLQPLRVESIIADKTVPPVAVRTMVLMEEASGIEVLKIEVPKSRTIIATRSGKILRRRMNIHGEPENLPLYPYEISSHLSELGYFDLSAQPLPDSSINDFDSNEIARLRSIITKQRGEVSLLQLSDEDLFKALRLAVYVNDKLTPTVTGILLIGKEECITEFIPAAQSAFQVMEGSSVRVNEQSRKPLLATFDFYMEILKAWNPERETTEGLFRIPIPEFDSLAFREALVNAFCHRDYALFGMTRILINESGLTISNPGGFVDGVTLKNLLTVEPHGRNPALSDALKRIGLAERTGRGIDRIFTGSIIYGRPFPDYSESDDFAVRVFIPRAHPDLAFYKMIIEEQDRTGIFFSINSLMILSVLRAERRLDIHGIVEKTNVIESRVKSDIENLIERGFIEAKGMGRGRTYMLSANVYKSNKHTAAYVRQTDIDRIRYPELVLKYIDIEGSITKASACELLHIAPMQAYRLLRKLVLERKINAIGRGRSTKYIKTK